MTLGISIVCAEEHTWARDDFKRDVGRGAPKHVAGAVDNFDTHKRGVVPVEKEGFPGERAFARRVEGKTEGQGAAPGDAFVRRDGGPVSVASDSA
eukprot:scaffold92334_cov30-Tisochrysis_lutea.AAC.3